MSTKGPARCKAALHQERALVLCVDEKTLGQWLDSPARAEWVQKLRARLGDFELQKLPGGFGPWFVTT